MTTALILSLIGLAAIDSLNPFTVAAQAYLLGTPRPMPRSLAFLGTTYATYLVGAVLIMTGINALIRRVMPLIPAWGTGAGEIALSLVLAGAAWFTSRRATAGKPFQPPGDLGLGATVAFAVMSTVGDVPTAVPLFAAAAQLASAGLAWHSVGLALGLYVLVYCAPLLALVGLRAALPERSAEGLFGRLRAGVDWAFAKLMPPMLWLGAAALASDGAIRLAAAVR